MRWTLGIATSLLLVGASLAGASPAESSQESPEAAAQSAARVEVAIVLSRQRGEERLSNLPYALRLSESPDARGQLRAALEVPVQVQEGAFQYRSVGTDIDCEAVPVERADGGDTHRLTITVEHSAVVPSSPDAFEGAPLFSTFQIVSTVDLDDGESVDLVSSTDPVTGEVMRIRVTLRVD